MPPRTSLPLCIRITRPKAASFACTNHKTPSRRFTTTRTVQSSNSSLPTSIPSQGFSALNSRCIITLSGPDTALFLQGLITQDMFMVPPWLDPADFPKQGIPREKMILRTTSFYASFLNSHGRVLSDVFIYRLPAETAPSLLSSTGGKFGFVDGEAWAVEVDAEKAESLFTHIKRRKLRSKFDLKMADVGVWSVWRDEAWKAHSLHPETSDTTPSFGDNSVACADTRAPGMGYRVLLPAGAKPNVEADESNESVYKVRRYLKGVPEGQNEIAWESSLPAESNIDFMGGIHWNKGCYLGQELTIRTRHMGVVRKRILPMMVYGIDEAEPKILEWKGEGEANLIPKDTSISRVSKKGRSAGKFLAGVGNLGLGLCRVEMMTNVVVQGEGGGYQEGDEFKVEFGEDDAKQSLKVKAFVPCWHLTK